MTLKSQKEANKNALMKSAVLSTAVTRNIIFSDVALCSVVWQKVYLANFLALKMESVRSSKTSVNFHQNT
jgi:hypothetical protein